MNEKVLHFGVEYPLQELIEVGEAEEDAKKAKLKKMYVSTLRSYVNERVKLYQKSLRVKPKTIEIDLSEHTKRWASCNTDRVLVFHYRLAMAPKPIIDYVVVHELCHLLHMNHDRSFWRSVGSVLPDYKKSRDFLDTYGFYFSI
ncbi:MAG: M48 family metallopeptidase [Eubacteriales bacterium]|nr:M48 family metallopeptidase [Eubacteriales bacterium]